MTFRVDKDVMVPMRDGVMLATDVWIPDNGPVPVLLVRLPYGKDLAPEGGLSLTMIPNALRLLEAGYAVVWQDCRGTHRSSGNFVPVVHEASDGADMIAWLLQQPWCNGSVGTFGISYLGMTQWAAASQSPDGLKAIATTMTTTDQYRSPWFSEGGALSWHLVWIFSTLTALVDAQRAFGFGQGNPQTLAELAGTLADPTSALQVMPPGDALVASYWPWLRDWLERAERTTFWQELSVDERPGDVMVPALNVGGWFDIFANSTCRTFTHMRSNAGSVEAREGQRLVMGPWDHMNYTGLYHDRQFGLMADALTADITGTHLKFYDRWLRGRSDALDGTSPVRIFVMGIDQWRDEQDWPLPDTTYVDYFLDSEGRANSCDGDGALSTNPATSNAVDRFDYDPANPVPTLGGRLLMAGGAAMNAVGPVDQRPVEARDDVLCFTTPVLGDPVEVTGHVTLVLHVASSATDTDFTGKLVDVFPDGRAIYLTDGILRSRYRNSLTDPEFLEPTQVYEIALDLGVTSNVFLPGHRIRLEVASSNFPRYDRNTNTGGLIADESLDQAVVATNDVLHGPDNPSRLILPVIRR